MQLQILVETRFWQLGRFPSTYRLPAVSGQRCIPACCADSDGDEAVDFGEFFNAMQRLNKQRCLNLSEGDIRLIFKSADLDKNGKIDYRCVVAVTLDFPFSGSSVGVTDVWAGCATGGTAVTPIRWTCRCGCSSGGVRRFMTLPFAVRGGHQALSSADCHKCGSFDHRVVTTTALDTTRIDIL